MTIRFALILLFLLIILSSGGCAWTESDAGKARYTYKVTEPDGTVHEIDLQNAKNVGLVSATVKYGDVEIELLEQGVDSSGPMGAMIEQNTMLMERALSLIPQVKQ